MVIFDAYLGHCDLEIIVEWSAVDSFIERGYSLDLDRELTEDELNMLQDKYTAEIQVYSYNNGSQSHN